MSKPQLSQYVTMVNITTLTIHPHQHQKSGTKTVPPELPQSPLRPLLQFQVSKHPKEPITLTMAMMILGFAEIVKVCQSNHGIPAEKNDL